MGIWLERLTHLLTEQRTPVVTVRGNELGLPLVLTGMLEGQGFGWVRLTARMRNDPILQGNALALALNGASNTKLFQQGLHYDIHLRRLAHYASELLPLRLAVTGSELADSLVTSLLHDLPAGVWLLLDYGVSEAVPSHLIPLPETRFLLSTEEAFQLAPGGLDDSVVLEDLHRSGRRRPAFLTLLSSRLTGNQPTGADPTSGSPRELHAPNLVVAALTRQKRFEEALELAVQGSPGMVEQIIRKAGPEFTRLGQLDRLHLLLSALDEPWSSLEATLEWRLVAGVATSDYRHLLPLVDEHLTSHPAPDLRARRAGLLPGERRQAMAEEALKLARTPLTLWQAGRMSPNHETAITLLQESVRLAEDSGTAYEIARNAGALASAYLDIGDLRRSVHWGAWALSVLDEGEIADVDRRKRILNDLSFAGMLCGETLGLEARLQDVLMLSSTASPEANANTMLTLGLLEMSDGRPEAAAALAEKAMANASRQLQAHTVHHRVLILLAAGQSAAARRQVEQAQAFSDGEVLLLASSARLAQGMLLALTGNEAARPILLEVMLESSNQIDQRLMAYLYSLLLPGPRPQRPHDLELALSQLSPEGLRLLSAPAESFSAIWQELLGREHELQLSVLGGGQATLGGETLKLTRRMWEVLLVIALHPDGIGDEQLHDFLVRDSGGFGLSALRTHVSRVRNLVPVSDTPYRLEVPYQLDLLELRRAIRSGDLREALRLARGPVLPDSETPGIQELRADAAAELEQAVYGSDDPEAVYSLAEELADDIGMWERTRELLPASDARRAVANARIGRLREQFS